ncbi:MAG: YidC/Oxa1 family membrane protein insertase [Patescibacteria group bacterium]|nr:YidC/Oxa1 family membrane protein insertase [Patescibacteria group bacterium]
MISTIFNEVFYNPIYNGLVFLIANFSWIDMGIAVIFITIIIKLIIFPLTKKSIKIQIKTKKLEPELKKIKEEYKDNKEEQARKIMDLYRENNLNPLSGFLVLLIQLPIIFALYFVFLKGGFPEINTDILYSFVKIPEVINMNFLGLISMVEKNIYLALLAGISQYIQVQLMLPKLEPRNNKQQKTFKDDLMRSMNTQMKFVMPIIVFFISYGLPAAVALYWITSNTFMILQEIFVKRKMESKPELIK